MPDFSPYPTNRIGKESDFCVAEVHYGNNEDSSSFEYRQNGKNSSTKLLCTYILNVGSSLLVCENIPLCRIN